GGLALLLAQHQDAGREERGQDADERDEDDDFHGGRLFPSGPLGAIGPGPKASRRRGDRDDRRRGGGAVARGLATRSGRSEEDDAAGDRRTRAGRPARDGRAAAGGPAAAARARTPPRDARR